MRAAALWLGLAALAITGTAHADDDGSRPIARGRGLTWGATAIAPVLLGDVREGDGRAIAYLQPGGGAEGRIGFELPAGISIGGLVGVSAHVSENSRAFTLYRLAAEARWVLDLGADVAPAFGLAAGLLLAQLDAGIRATAYARLALGVDVLIAQWISLSVALAVEGALPGDAFADPIAWLTPQVGVVFYE